ncbi:Rieske 2Fe-2S domain-containing protein [Actinomadura scrupuli]|uniref:Rieske 2Fe-2S domain-containing protein n=1 Tax=Actinomadura scrupuli TaxID=559629 RepID=UPI003D97DF77
MRFLRRRARLQGGLRRDAGFVRVCEYGEIAPGQIRRVAGLPVLLCRHGDRLYAVGWVCTHASARLMRGRLVEDCLECPLHGARFALDGGEVRRGPARRGLPVHDVEIRAGVVYVARRPRRRGLLSGGRR